MNKNELLVAALDQNNINIDTDQLEQLSRFLDLIQQWNKVFNLTNITATKEMVYLHIIDSLVIHPYLHGKRIIDIGSGAGLPGIPLAIINPDKEWALLDKNNKKTRFMTQAAAELGLKNVKAIHSRAEEFHPADGFDTILSRALSTLDSFCQSSEHLLAKDGRWLAMKGREPKEEMDALATRFVLQQCIRLDIKGADIERHLICIKGS